MKKKTCFLPYICVLLVLVFIGITSKPTINQPVRVINSPEEKQFGKDYSSADNIPTWVKRAAKRYIQIERSITELFENINHSTSLYREIGSGLIGIPSETDELAHPYSFLYDVRVNSVTDNGQIQPAVCTGSDGTIYVAWADSATPGGHLPGIYFSKSTDDGSTFAPRVLVDPNGPNIRPSIAVYGTGSYANVYIVYSYIASAENLDYDIYYAVSRNGGTSWAIRGLATSDRFEGYPDIAVDAQNFVYIAYTYGYNRREGCWDFEPEVDIVLRVSPDGGTTFRGAVFVASQEGHIEMQPSIAVQGAGTSSIVHIAYDYDVFGDERDYDILYRKVFNAGSTNPTPGAIITAAQTPYRDLITSKSLAIGNDNNPHIAYTTNTGGGGNWDVYYCRSTDGGNSFSVRVPIATQAYVETDPAIGVDSYNNPFVAWVDRRNGNSDIYMCFSNNGGYSFGRHYRVNRDETSYDQYWVDLSVWKGGERRRIDLVWWDTRYNAGDIYYNGNLQYHLGLTIRAIPDTAGMGTIPFEYYTFEEPTHLDLTPSIVHIWYDPGYPSSPLLSATSTSSGSTERWFGRPNPSTGWEFLDPNWWDPPEYGNYEVNYYHQYWVRFAPQRAPGCVHPMPNANLSYRQFGNTINRGINDMTPVTAWVDARSSWSMTNPIPLTPTERWISPDTVSGIINSSRTFSPTYYHQWYPLIFFTGPSETNYVWTEEHYMMGNEHLETGLYNSFQEWADCGRYLDFSDSTNLGWFAVDSTRFLVNSFFTATIHYANVVRITVQNSFDGGEVIVDGVRYPSPFTGEFGPGSSHTIAAVSPQTLGDTLRYIFSHWSDGGDSAHTVIVPLYSYTYTANFIRQYRLTMSYEGTTGGFTPVLTGEGWYNEGEPARITATAGFDSIDGIRYGFSRWRSVPDGATFADSFANETRVFMTRSFLVIARYAVQFRLIVNNPEGYDAPYPPAGINWRDAGSTVECYASPDTIHHMYPIGFTGTGSAPSGSGNSVRFTINEPSSITWHWAEMISLTVYSDYGAPSPSVGTHWYPPGSYIVATVSSPVNITPGIRAVVLGYAGSGSVPSGSGNTVGFVLEESSTLTWRWAFEYRFIVMNPDGYDSPYPPVGEHWYLGGTRVEGYVISPVGDMYCIGYTGTGSLISGPSSSFSFIINAPSSVRWNWAPFSDIVSLTINSPYGDPRPNGTVYYLRGSLVTASVTSPFYPPSEDGTRYLCTGFNGTGSAPSTGTDTIVTFTINMNSTITWHWQRQYRFVVNNPGGWDSPVPPEGTYWYDPGTVVTGYAERSVGDTVICTGYTGTGSLLSDTTNHFSFIINMPSSITWNWMTRTFTLTIVSEYGTPIPSRGSHRYTDGSQIEASVERLVSLGDGVRAICTGWLGTGSVPESGDTNWLRFIIRNDSEIRWQWRKQYRFIVENPGGFDNPNPPVGEHWYDELSLVEGQVDTSDGLWYCVGFVGTGSLRSLDGYNYFSFVINEPSSVRWLWDDIRNISRLYVYSDYGYPFPSPGIHYYRNGTIITAYANHYYYESEGIRYALRGYTGTGSVPASGTDTTVTFRILMDSSIRWDWRKEVRLIIQNPGGYDSPYPPEGLYWLPYETEIYAYVESPVDSMFCVGYDAMGSISSGEGTSVAFTLTQPTLIRWIWMGEGSVVPLEVISPYGRPYPIAGTTYYPFGTTIRAFNDSVYSVSPGERWICIGFRGSGSVPDSGAGTSVEFTLRRPSRLEWIWVHQYRISLEYYGTGIYVPEQRGAGWYSDGSVTNISTEPFVGDTTIRYGFVRWASNPDGATIGDMTASSTTVIVNNSYTLQAYYAQAYLCRVMKSPTEDTLGSIIVDGVEYRNRSSLSFYWAVGSTHTITVSRTDSSGDMQYRFVSWSTGSRDTTIRVIITGATTFTATYDIYYRVRVNVFPSDVRTTITIGREYTVFNSNYGETWANARDGVVFVQVGLMEHGTNPNERFIFSHWNDGGELGHYAVLTGPLTLGAYYNYQYRWVIRKEPLQTIGYIVYNDTTFLSTGMLERWLTSGVSFTVFVSSPDISRDSVYTFQRWSDGGSQRHTVGPISSFGELIAYYRTEPIRTDFSVMPTSWNIGNVLIGENRTMAFGEEIRLVNEGNVPITYILAIDTTGIRHWRESCMPGLESYMIRAQFNNYRPGSFSRSYDCVKSSLTEATSIVFGPEGFNVPVGGVQKLWLSFDAPTSSGYFGVETIKLLILSRPALE